MNIYRDSTSYKKGVLICLVLFLLGIRADAATMGGKEAIPAGNIGGMLLPTGAAILINGNMPSINVLGGPSLTPAGPGIFPPMISPAASIAGSDLIVGMNGIVPGPGVGQVMLPNISPAMGQIPIFLSGIPVFTDIMITGIIGPCAINPFMMGVNPTNVMGVNPTNVLGVNPMNVIGVNPMNVLGVNPTNVMGVNPTNLLFMCPDPMTPLLMGPNLMNPLMVQPAPYCPFMIGPCPMNCVYQTISKNVKKGNINLLEVHDGCTGRIYHGYPAGAWLAQILKTPQPVTDYRWWYGCSPTCAGMMMAYYDRYPYYADGITYDLIPGDIAEVESFLNPDPWYSGDPLVIELVKLCNRAIASKEHALDFWSIPTDPSASFGLTLDPLASPRKGNPAGFNCLADFMGTSQNDLFGNKGNPDGITWFWFPSDGSILSSSTANWPDWYNSDYSGMYGLVEWAGYCQTITGQSMNPYAYNQYIEGYTPPNGLAPITGFSFYDYQTEIDSGRPVMLLLMDWGLDAAHSVLGVGYGYDPVTGRGEAYIHDTWALNNPLDPKTIPWVNGPVLYSVTVAGILHTFNFELIGVIILS